MTGLVKAYLVANVKRAAEHKVAKKIRKMKEVTEARYLWTLGPNRSHRSRNFGASRKSSPTYGKSKKSSRPARS